MLFCGSIGFVSTRLWYSMVKRNWRGVRQGVCVCGAILPRPPAFQSCSLNYMQLQEAMKKQHSRYFVVNVMTPGADESSVDGELSESSCDHICDRISVLHRVTKTNDDVCRVATVPASCWTHWSHSCTQSILVTCNLCRR